MDEMSAKMPWFPFYGRDFFCDEAVKVLSFRQIGIYLYLLWHQWEHKSIPCYDDCERFPCIVSDAFNNLGLNEDIRESEVFRDLRDVFDKFFSEHPLLENRFINTRLEQVREEQEKKEKDRHERAVKGGLARSSRQAELKLSLSIPTSSAQASQSESESDTESDTESEEEKREECPPGEFETFWKEYPSRNGKKLDREATKILFISLKPKDRALAIHAAKHYANSQQVREGIGIKDPKRFLRDGKGSEPWRDWIEPEVPTKNERVILCAVQVRKRPDDKFMKPCGNPVEPGKSACTSCIVAIAKLKGEVK